MRAEYRKNMKKVKRIDYIHKTWKNKVCAVALLVAGTLGVTINRDLVSVFLICFAVPLFFTKKQRFDQMD